MKNKTYSNLIKIPTFKERIQYLMLRGPIGSFTFNGHRYLNQMIYKCVEWKRVRRDVIIRDSLNGYVLDLGMDDHPITGSVFVHHINPITVEDILERRLCVFDPENLICSSERTHKIIHYGDDESVSNISLEKFVTRKPDDTCLWR